jgi:hypothetical protein
MFNLDQTLMPRRTARRARSWSVRVLHPVTGAHLYTLICTSKRDAVADAARSIRPDRAPALPSAVY